MRIEFPLYTKGTYPLFPHPFLKYSQNVYIFSLVFEKTCLIAEKTSGPDIISLILKIFTKWNGQRSMKVAMLVYKRFCLAKGKTAALI